MTHLIRIGNSQGIRIPKLLIEQANLQGRELELEVMNGGLFIAPI
jgi:antitoxin MazE